MQGVVIQLFEMHPVDFSTGHYSCVYNASGVVSVMVAWLAWCLHCQGQLYLVG